MAHGLSKPIVDRAQYGPNNPESKGFSTYNPLTKLNGL